MHAIELADKKSILLSDLLVYLRDNLLKERPELFMQNKTVYEHTNRCELIGTQSPWHSRHGQRD